MYITYIYIVSVFATYLIGICACTLTYILYSKASAVLNYSLINNDSSNKNRCFVITIGLTVPKLYIPRQHARPIYVNIWVLCPDTHIFLLLCGVKSVYYIVCIGTHLLYKL